MGHIESLCTMWWTWYACLLLNWEAHRQIRFLSVFCFVVVLCFQFRAKKKKRSVGKCTLYNGYLDRCEISPSVTYKCDYAIPNFKVLIIHKLRIIPTLWMIVRLYRYITSDTGIYTQFSRNFKCAYMTKLRIYYAVT